MIAARMRRMSCLMEYKIANYNIVWHYTLRSKAIYIYIYMHGNYLLMFILNYLKVLYIIPQQRGQLGSWFSN